MSYAVLKAANVGGTAALLRLALESRVRPRGFHFVSSVAALPVKEKGLEQAYSLTSKVRTRARTHACTHVHTHACSQFNQNWCCASPGPLCADVSFPHHFCASLCSIPPSVPPYSFFQQMAARDGYGQTKAVAERLLVHAAEKFGLPFCCYRPSVVSGATDTGFSNTADFENHLIRAMCVACLLYTSPSPRDRG